MIMTLYHKHRPSDFDSLIGNDSTIQSIKSILLRDQSQWPHAWLFVGLSGTGKTTLARILAKHQNVHDNNLHELNIARMRGIDAAREIQSQTYLAPMGGGNAGWILDECHRGTPEFFDCMLKTLEDTPKHVYFYLCTTDPTSIPKTIIGRCHEYQMQALTYNQLYKLVQDVVQLENATVPPNVIRRIALDSNGSGRVALVALDKIINMQPDSMLDAVQAAMVEQKNTLELCEALINLSSWQTISKLLHSMGEYDAENVRRAVMGYCNSKLMRGDNPRAWIILDTFRQTQPRYNGRYDITWAAWQAIKTMEFEK